MPPSASGPATTSAEEKAPVPSRTLTPEAARKLAAAPLYPTRAKLIRHVTFCVLRVATFCTLGVLLAHPLVTALYTYLGMSTEWFLPVVGMSLHTGFCLAFVGFFAFCKRFKLLEKYKIARTKAMANKPGFIAAAWKNFFIFHFVERVLVCVFLSTFAPYGDVLTVPLDPVWEIFLMFSINHLLGEFVLYWYHRSQHKVTWLYGLHKGHHEFHSTEAIATEYADHMELIIFTVLNYMSTRHKPVTVHFVIILWKLWENHEAHCGYNFNDTFLGRIGMLNGMKTEFHDFHHSHNRGNYGANLLFDYVYHTADEYLLHLDKLGKKALQ